jgi:hypothetical protein
MRLMVKAFRVVGKTDSPRYRQLKDKLVEHGKRNGEITSRSFAAYIGIFSESSARNWLAVFEADDMIMLVRRDQGGQKVYLLTNSLQGQTTRSCDNKDAYDTTSKINLLNNRFEAEEQ